MMKYSEQFMEHIEYAFAAFCKSFSAMRQSARTAIGTETEAWSITWLLMSETSFEPFATDNYFEQYVYESRLFLLCKGKKLSLQVDG